MRILVHTTGGRSFEIRLHIPEGGSGDGDSGNSGYGRVSRPGVPDLPETPGMQITPIMPDLPTLAQAVYLSGFFEPPALCSGLGRCGRCRVRFFPDSQIIPQALEIDIAVLGQEAVSDGWRLGCRHRAADGMLIELPHGIRVETRIEAGIETPAAAATKASSAVFASAAPGGVSGRCALAVDFGSTSLHYACVEVDAARPDTDLESRVLVNPQMGAGGDIMSRLAWAAGAVGREQLRDLSQKALERMLAEPRPSAPGGEGWGPEAAGTCPATELVLAANPAMIYLILGKDAAGLRAAPYYLDYAGGREERLDGLPPLWVCPLISPFVGGDISAGYAALVHGVVHGLPHRQSKDGTTEEHPPAGKGGLAYPFLLADLGTNGELLLALDENTALAASLPLGPALEGIGMRWGAEARSGPLAQPVITGFKLSPLGLEPALFVASAPARYSLPENPARGGNSKAIGSSTAATSSAPVGISATGYLSLLHNLRKLGLLGEDGHFSHFAQTGAASGYVSDAVPPSSTFPPSPLIRKLQGQIRPLPHGEPAWFVTPDMYVSAGDIEELLKVKAAFSLACKILLEQAGVRPNGLAAVYLAGSLGRHVDVGALIHLGFLPASLRQRIFAVGNSSLAGAALLARRPELRDPLCRWAAGVKTVSLTEAGAFQESFAGAMTFGQT